MNHPEDDWRAEEPSVGGELYETEVGGRTPSEAVIDVVSAIKDVEPSNLSPLYRAIDPDALDSLCESDCSDTEPTVRFDYDGLVVTVSGSGTLTVLEP